MEEKKIIRTNTKTMESEISTATYMEWNLNFNVSREDDKVSTIQVNGTLDSGSSIYVNLDQNIFIQFSPAAAYDVEVAEAIVEEVLSIAEIEF